MKALGREEATRRLASLTDEQVALLKYDWSLNARDDQRAPGGDWSIWLVMGGRGAGKTRTGAETVRAAVMAGYRRIALVAETAADARDVMVEGDSGILAISHATDADPQGRNTGVPLYEPSKRRLTWKNGALAFTYNAVEPGQLRGPQHDFAWADEVAKWRYDDAWDQLMFGLRLGSDPRCVATTTPRPRKLIRGIRFDEDTVVTGASTYANRHNLAPRFVNRIVRRFDGTRLGRQELHGELLEDTPGALWTLDQIDALRVEKIPGLIRVVVAIDPAASNNEHSDEHGIVVAGIARDGQVYVLEDISRQGSPEQWAQTAIEAYDRHDADRIVAEVNNGGDMVESVIRSTSKAMKATGQRQSEEVAYSKVHATRGKVIRAEPVSALYEQGRAHHVGSFKELEDQMASFTHDYDRSTDGSPDRMDALVWAVTELTGGNVIPTAGVVSVDRTAAGSDEWS